MLLARSPRFRVRVLARPSDKNRALLKKMAHPMAYSAFDITKKLKEELNIED